MTILLSTILLSMASILILSPANAHDPAWSIPTYSFINIAPSPIGVGQTVNVNFWLNAPPPTAAGAYGDRWTNLSVEVTKPDGTKETQGHSHPMTQADHTPHTLLVLLANTLSRCFLQEKPYLERTQLMDNPQLIPLLATTMNHPRATYSI